MNERESFKDALDEAEKNGSEEIFKALLKEIIQKVPGGKQAIAIRAGIDLFSKANEIEVISAILSKGKNMSFDEKLDLQNRLNNFQQHQKRILEEVGIPYEVTDGGILYKGPISFGFALDYYKEVRDQALKILGIEKKMSLENIIRETEIFIKNILTKNGYDCDDEDMPERLFNTLKEMKLKDQEQQTKENQENQKKEIVN